MHSFAKQRTEIMYSNNKAKVMMRQDFISFVLKNQESQIQIPRMRKKRLKHTLTVRESWKKRVMRVDIYKV